MSTVDSVPIAIVGTGCRFPGGADSPAALWRLLNEGRGTAGLVPEDRWDAARLAAFQHPDDIDKYRWGCFLDNDIWAWEPEALSVARIEAATVDPQHRLVMEVAQEAVEHAGIPLGTLRGSRTGVYLGCYSQDHLMSAARPLEDYPELTYLYGSFAANMVGRIAFAMDLRGPAMVIETFCSSGLVAVHTACQALKTGDCDTALAGAVLLMSSAHMQHYEAEWLLSRQGRCFAFDERADGYVRGEGAGVVLLKRLPDAVAAGDRILAVIRGSGISADGASERITAPSTTAQQAAYRTALDHARVSPGDVGLVEAHGPGTEVGDPVEYNSINTVYGRGSGRCALGSIKTVIGHTEPVAGVAGLIKTVLCLRYGQIPPNLNFRVLNPAIKADPESRLFIPTQRCSWPVEGGPRLAAVCSYGISGTNVHMIVEQAPATARPSTPRRDADAEPARVFLLSTVTRPALPLTTTRLADWLEGDEGRVTPLEDLAHTLAVRRSHAAERVGVVAASHAELVSRLRAFAVGEDCPGVASGFRLLEQDGPGPVLVFPGLGGQWPAMARGLLDTEPAFTAVIDELEPLMAAESGLSMRALITDPVLRGEAENVQPAMFGIQVALAAVWRSWGIRPVAVIGQSMGEVAAAVVAGALSLGDGLRLACRRAEILHAARGGAMAMVGLAPDQVARDIETAGATGVAVGVLSSPHAAVVSGNATQLAVLATGWRERDLMVREVDVDVASHSPDLDPFLERFGQSLRAAGLRPRAPEVPIFSTVSDDPRDPGLLDADYWVSNIRRTVRFWPACEALLAQGHRLFVECSVHPLAARAIQDIARYAHTRDVVTVGTLRRDTDDNEAFLTNLAAAHAAGHPVDWASHYGAGALVDAPTTTWNRVRHRQDLQYQMVAPNLVGAAEHSLLGGYVHDPDHPERHLWQTPISPDRVPWLIDHQLDGVPIMAGAGICEMLLAAGATVFATDRVLVKDLVLERPLVLEAPEPIVTVRAVRDGERAHVEVVSTVEGGQVRHGHGTVTALDESGPDTNGWRTADESWIDVVPTDLYTYFQDWHGITHGPAFAGLERVQLAPEQDVAVARLRLANPARVSSWMMRLHPALLDQVGQTAAAVWRDRYSPAQGPVVVSEFAAVRVFGPTGHARRAYVRLDHADSHSVSVSGALATSDGRLVAQIEGLRIVSTTPPEQRFLSRLAHHAWVEDTTGQPSETAVSDGSWVVLAEPADPSAVAVADALLGRGVACHLRQIPLAGSVDLNLDDLAPCAGVVLAVMGPDTYPEMAPPAVARARVARACTLAGQLAALPHPPRLWIVTRADNSSLAAAGLRGVARTALYECPALAPSMVEIDTSTDLGSLATELLSAGPPVEVAWRSGTRHTARLRAGAPHAPAPLAASVHEDGAYLITGGLGGLGLATAQWLVDQGARHLLLLGRSEPSSQAEQTLASLRERGARVAVMLGDIGDPTTSTNAVRAAQRLGGTLRGICHAAGVVDDATLATLTHDQRSLNRVWHGKVSGAWNLHEASLGLSLDWFLLYSSVVALIGSPGQAAHAAANTWLDDLATWRVANHLPATSIQWGAWEQVGKGQHMGKHGWTMISPTDGVDAVDRILTLGHTTVAYAPIDLHRWVTPYPDVAATPLFAELLRTEDTPRDGETGTALAELLAADSQTVRHELLTEHIIGQIRDLLGITGHITPATSMVTLGLDSLGAVQLRQRLQRSLKVTLELGVVWVKPTADALAAWILHRMGLTEDIPAVAETTPRPARPRSQHPAAVEVAQLGHKGS